MNPKPGLLSFLAVDCFLQRLSQLIGAGGGLHTALDALHTGDHILNVHTFHQSADALQIAVAAAQELDIGDLAVLDIEEDLLGANALGFVLVTHIKISFLFM